MNKAIKYRIYPTSEQMTLITSTFDCCRNVWNLMLSDKLTAFRAGEKIPMVTPAIYKENHPYLKDVDSLALCNEQIALQQAFSRFFKKKAGFPNFKSKKHSRKTYTTNCQKGSVVITDNKIKLPKLGKVRAKIHRQPKPDWQIKSATISQSADNKFYISVLFEFEQEIIQKPITNNAIGLDYKSDGLYMDSNGNIGSNHKYYKESHKKLAHAQQKLKHMVVDSNNYVKQQKRIAKIYTHIANQRFDNLHKLSTEIANQYDIVCVENLNMRTLASKNFHNGKATLDNGYGMFLKMLEYKLADRGKYFVKIDKWYPSSQLCSGCGKQHFEMKDIKVRNLICDCGLTIDRDHNAAINILREGLRLLSE